MTFQRMRPGRVLRGIGHFVLLTVCGPERAVAADPGPTTAPVRRTSPALALPPVDFNNAELSCIYSLKHYARRDVTKQDAEKWFSIRPPRRARNVVPMRGAG